MKNMLKMLSVLLFMTACSMKPQIINTQDLAAVKNKEKGIIVFNSYASTLAGLDLNGLALRWQKYENGKPVKSYDNLNITNGGARVAAPFYDSTDDYADTFVAYAVDPGTYYFDNSATPSAGDFSTSEFLNKEPRKIAKFSVKAGETVYIGTLKAPAFFKFELKDSKDKSLYAEAKEQFTEDYPNTNITIGKRLMEMQDTKSFWEQLKEKPLF